MIIHRHINNGAFSVINFYTKVAVQLLVHLYRLLWQRDRATRLSVEILQLQNILFEN